jgi:diketogulonate reductase-like aldo/keto reductase
MCNPQSALYTTDQPLQIALIAYAPLEQMFKLKVTYQDTLPVAHSQIDMNMQKEHNLQKSYQAGCRWHWTRSLVYVSKKIYIYDMV